MTKIPSKAFYMSNIQLLTLNCLINILVTFYGWF